MTLEITKLKNIVEAALFSAGQPLSLDNILVLFDDGEQPEKAELKTVLQSLQEDYAERGVELKEVASGYRFQARAEVGPWVSRLWAEKPARYSRALLETMALIAYRQPITRGEIEEIRGVSVSSYIVKTLLERQWIRSVGHRDVPGRPTMYATTREFLDYFNLKNLDELPSLQEIRDLNKINEELDLEDPGATASTVDEGVLPAIEPSEKEEPDDQTESDPSLWLSEDDDLDDEGLLSVDEVDAVLAAVESNFRPPTPGDEVEPADEIEQDRIAPENAHQENADGDSLASSGEAVSTEV